MIVIAEPKNHSNSLDCHNALYVGSSGSGKTTAVKNLNIKKQDCAVFFDPFGDYAGSFQGQVVHTYYNWPDFAENLFKARLSGQPFKIARGFEGRVNSEDFDLFCGLVWACGDSNLPPLNVVMEELAQYSKGSGKAGGYYGALLSVGRKFNLRSHCVFQRGQEVEKTLFTNCPVKWVGYQERDNDAVYLANELGLPVDEIKGLQKLEYIVKDSSHEKGQFEKSKFTFKSKTIK
ncbi:type IV secretory system conjugative DNA transfer family protein [Photobacterium damselae]|uniref:type IV secretory system conjugative DNA transfer family protein n=1 Tax=Photobacterium damselae TaxID=38293 RepID=UPI0040675AEB